MSCIGYDGDCPTLRRPLHRVDVELTSVDGHPLSPELLTDTRVAEGVQAHPHHHRALGRHVSPEDLADADLRRVLGLILVADHPQATIVYGSSVTLHRVSIRP